MTVNAEWIIPEGLAGNMERQYRAVVDVISKSYPEQIERVIISAKREPPISLAVNGVWVFTRNYFGGFEPSSSRSTAIKYDISRFSHRIDYVEIRYDNYDLEMASSASQFGVVFTTSDGNSATLDAVDVGCDELLKFVRDVVYTNLTAVRD